MSTLRTNAVESITGTATDFPNSLKIQGTLVPSGSAATEPTSRFPYVVGSVAELRGDSIPLEVSTAVLEGRTDADIAGGGFFYIDKTDTTTPDNGGTVFVNSQGHRWKRRYFGSVHLEWFKPAGSDSDTDDAAVAAAILAANESGCGVDIDRDIYLGSTLLHDSPVWVRLNGHVIYGASTFVDSAPTYPPTAVWHVVSNGARVDDAEITSLAENNGLCGLRVGKDDSGALTRFMAKNIISHGFSWNGILESQGVERSFYQNIELYDNHKDAGLDPNGNFRGQSVTGTIIDGIYVHDTAGKGVAFGNSSDCRISKVICEDLIAEPAREGIYTNDCQDIYWDNVITRRTTSTGAKFSRGSRRIHLMNSRMERSFGVDSGCLYLQGASDCTVSKSEFVMFASANYTTSAIHAIRLENHPTGPQPCDNNLFYDCVGVSEIAEQTPTALFVGSQSGVPKNNRFYNCTLNAATTGGGGGVRIQGEATVLENCNIDCASVGARIDSDGLESEIKGGRLTSGSTTLDIRAENFVGDSIKLNAGEAINVAASAGLVNLRLLRLDMTRTGAGNNIFIAEDVATNVLAYSTYNVSIPAWANVNSQFNISV